MGSRTGDRQKPRATVDALGRFKGDRKGDRKSDTEEGITRRCLEDFTVAGSFRIGIVGRIFAARVSNGCFDDESGVIAFSFLLGQSAVDACTSPRRSSFPPPLISPRRLQVEWAIEAWSKR